MRGGPGSRRRGRGIDLSLLVLVAGLVAAGLLSAIVTPPGSVAEGSPSATQTQPFPVFAYFYIWYDSSSWNRAKTDYPLAGHYSSDNVDVMRRQIQQAKSAGIDGFIVSWKDTPVLTPRLEKLVDIAEQESFRLAIIYQGLDFDRDPIAADKVAQDLDLFAERFAGRKPFAGFAKPLVIWSGTWQFSEAEVAKVTTGRRDRLQILASERSVEGYKRIANLVDGDAYYWSSVDPASDKGYAKKLADMGTEVHARGGIWIPPAAPGFDAQLIGGARNVARDDGNTLRTEYSTALRSSPDVMGLISWNEYSENSYVEPSEKYGDRYLRVLADINRASAPVPLNLDSSEPGTGPLTTGGVPIVAGFAGVVGVAFAVAAVRALRVRSEP